MDQVVQGVFFGKEILEQRAAAHRRGVAGFVEETDVAARAQGFLAAAGDHDRVDLAVVAPGQQHLGQAPHHLQR